MTLVVDDDDECRDDEGPTAVEVDVDVEPVVEMMVAVSLRFLSSSIVDLRLTYLLSSSDEEEEDDEDDVELEVKLDDTAVATTSSSEVDSSVSASDSVFGFRRRFRVSRDRHSTCWP